MRAADAQPLDDAATEALFARFAGKNALALAVSGGPDSTALMLLAARWRENAGGGTRIRVLTVDHGLRADAAGEARAVGQWAARLGLEHRILRWDGDKPRANIQAEARRARYRLMAQDCHRQNIALLATAHHLEDQAETLLLRLARGSGVDGLAAMAGETAMMGLTVIRPLLEVPRARLAATLEAAGQPSFADPSNEDRRFARVRMRALMRQMEDEGLTAKRLAETARRLAGAREALDAAADALARDCARLDPAGYCVIAPRPVLGAPRDTALRLLARVLGAVGGEPYPPRLARLEALLEALEHPAFTARTLAGCRIARRGDAIAVWREEGRGGLPELLLKPGGQGLWDGRFAVRAGRELTQPVRVRALGRQDWRGLRGAARGGPGAAIARTFVSFWVGDRLLFAPHAPQLQQDMAARAAVEAHFVGTVARDGANSPATKW